MEPFGGCGRTTSVVRERKVIYVRWGGDNGVCWACNISKKKRGGEERVCTHTSSLTGAYHKIRLELGKKNQVECGKENALKGEGSTSNAHLPKANLLRGGGGSGC